jgi:hypothetical protein
MAQDITNGISYYLSVAIGEKDNLGTLRNWSNLKVAFDKNKVWVTGFELAQIESVAVKSIPSKNIYYSKNAQLFLQNSLLPDQKEPAFLWTPIERALPLELTNFNNNYFGIEEGVKMKLISTDNEQRAIAMLLELNLLKTFVESAPAIRLDNLTWTLLNKKDALLFGTPLLPIDGEAFWLNEGMLLPVGYQFELDSLVKLVRIKIDPDNEQLIIWNEDSTYFKVNKEAIEKLTISSFRKTMNTNNEF